MVLRPMPPLTEYKVTRAIPALSAGSPTVHQPRPVTKRSARNTREQIS